MIAYLDGSLDGELRSHVEEHLSSCPGCRDNLATLARFWTSESAARERQSASYLWPGIESSIVVPEKRRFKHGSYVLKFAAAALILIVSLLLGNYIGNIPRSPAVSGLPIEESRYLVRNYHLDSFKSVPDESIGMTFLLTSEKKR